MTASATLAYAADELRPPRTTEDGQRVVRRPARSTARRRAVAESLGHR